MDAILPLLCCLFGTLRKTTIRQLSQIALAMLTMTGRVTMRGLSRWIGTGRLQALPLKERCHVERHESLCVFAPVRQTHGYDVTRRREENEDSVTFAIGELTVPLSAQFIVNDGQHRRAAILDFLAPVDLVCAARFTT